LDKYAQREMAGGDSFHRSQRINHRRIEIF